MNASFLGMVNQTGQWNICYIKWSINPIRKQKAMPHNVIQKLLNKRIHMNTTGRNESKFSKKINWTRNQISTKIELDVLCSFSLWPFRSVVVSVCGRFGLWPFRFVAVSVCGRLGFDRFGLWPLWPETTMKAWHWAISALLAHRQCKPPTKSSSIKGMHMKMFVKYWKIHSSFSF